MSDPIDLGKLTFVMAEKHGEQAMSDPIDLGKLTFVMAEKHGEQAMSDPIDLDELRALLEKATPGPWEIEGRYETGVYLIPAEHKGRARGFAVCQEYDRDNYQQTIASLNDDRHGRGGASENAELITALRNALPALLDELQAFRDGARPCHDCPDLQAAIDDLETELASARAKLEAVKELLPGEWSAHHGQCPWCEGLSPHIHWGLGRDEEAGHEPDCPYAALEGGSDK